MMRIAYFTRYKTHFLKKEIQQVPHLPRRVHACNFYFGTVSSSQTLFLPSPCQLEVFTAAVLRTMAALRASAAAAAAARQTASLLSRYRPASQKKQRGD